MRLLLTADAVGGVWQYGLDLARALGPLGVECVVAVLGPAPDADRRAEAAAAGVQLVETRLPLDWLCDGPEPVLAAGEAVAALARAHAADVVQLNTPALAARARFDAPVVAAAHGCVGTWWRAAHGCAPDLGYAWSERLTGEGLARADLVVAPSAAHAEAVRRHYGLARPPVAVHNGRTPIAGTPDGEPAARALTAGRLWDRVKRTDLLDRVAARVPAPFLAAGPLAGPHGEAVEVRNLVPLGALSAAALGRELARRPVFVSAACFEPFGLAVLEAAQAGCVLVLSDIPTFRELWDGAAAFAADEAGFADAVAALLADPGLRAERGAAAAARAARHTPEATAAAMAGLYARLPARSAVRSRAA